MGLDAATIHVSRDQNHLVWDPAIPAVASVGSGEVLELDCLDASFGQLNAESTNETLARLDFDRVDQVTGPVAVEGAEPGDTLQIDLLEFEPADWGWTASIRFGLLADDFPDPEYKVTRLQAGAGRVEFWPGIRIPLAPFCGVIGVAPTAGPLSTIPPDVHGGNMDQNHLVAGSTLYLPVFQPGAACPPATGTHAGRRRGVRHRHRDADARLASGSRWRGSAADAPAFLAAPDPHAVLRTARSTRPTASGPT